MMESAYRLIGIRSGRQSRELEAFYANKNAQTHQAALKEELSQYTRAMIRDGNTEALPEVFNQYIKNGGDPRNFRRWLKGTYVAATSTRGQRMLEKVAKDPAKMDQVLRLLDAGVTPAGSMLPLMRTNRDSKPRAQVGKKEPPDSNESGGSTLGATC
jgi:hypothetical protein